MFTCKMINQALNIYEESRGVLVSLTMWARGGESALIAKIIAFMEMQNKEGASETVNLSAKQLYDFMYIFMPFSTAPERNKLMFAFAKVLPEPTYWWFKDLMDACQKHFFGGSLTQSNFDAELQRTAGLRSSSKSQESLQLKVSHS